MNTEDFNSNLNNQGSANINNSIPPKKKGRGITRFIPFLFILGIIVVVAMLIFPKFFFGDETNKPTNNTVEPNKPTEPEKPKEPEVPEIKIIDLKSKTRPVGIMINCHNEALPQSGLQDAYAVYELMVEGGITRMYALFKDKDFTKVGSVRSVRAQFIAYAYENDAIIVHAGGSSEALKKISKEKIDNINVDGKYGQRDSALAKKRAWEHTLFTKMSSLKQAISDNKMRSTTETKPVLFYTNEGEINLNKYTTAKTANSISIKYSNYRTSNYEYDTSKKVYLRKMNSTKNIDLVTGKQYEVKNVVAYGVKYTNYCVGNYCAYVRPANVGTGEGYYFTNGMAIPITWVKKTEQSQTKYYVKENGKELKVNDGNTYFQIYPTNGGSLVFK